MYFCKASISEFGVPSPGCHLLGLSSLFRSQLTCQGFCDNRLDSPARLLAAFTFSCPVLCVIRAQVKHISRLLTCAGGPELFPLPVSLLGVPLTHTALHSHPAHHQLCGLLSPHWALHDPRWLPCNLTHSHPSDREVPSDPTGLGLGGTRLPLPFQMPVEAVVGLEVAHSFFLIWLQTDPFLPWLPLIC